MVGLYKPQKVKLKDTYSATKIPVFLKCSLGLGPLGRVGENQLRFQMLTLLGLYHDSFKQLLHVRSDSRWNVYLRDEYFVCAMTS